MSRASPVAHTVALRRGGGDGARGTRPRLAFVLEWKDMATASVICIDPEIMSGTPVFAGTRVPVQTLLDYLKAGDRIDDFLDQFPTVTRAQAEAFLELAGEAVTRHARSA